MSGAITQSRLQVGAFDVRVWTCGTGSGEGAPLLYLHGFEQHPGAAPYLAQLGERREVIAPEHPGYGDSRGLEQLQDIVDVVLYYRRMLETWGKGPVDIVGHSLGGLFAAEIAAIAPQLTRRLVLVNPFGLWLDEVPTPDPFTQTPAQLAKLAWHDPARAANETSAFDPAGGDSAATFRAINLAAATKFLWPLPDRGTRRRLPYISAPTLILHGEADALVPPSHAHAWAASIQGARRIGVANAGHHPLVEAEETALAAIRDFLA